MRNPSASSKPADKPRFEIDWAEVRWGLFNIAFVSILSTVALLHWAGVL